MRSWRGLVVLAVLLVVTAACNGSSAQREALLRLNGAGGAGPSGSVAPDQTGAAVPADVGTGAPEVPSAGSVAGSSGAAAPSPGATPGGKLPASAGSRWSGSAPAR